VYSVLCTVYSVQYTLYIAVVVLTDNT